MFGMKKTTTTTKTKYVGLTPVTSGQVLISDPAYSLGRNVREDLMDSFTKEDFESNAFEVKLEKDHKNPIWNHDFKEGIIVNGFGGDGMYPVSIEIIDDKDSFYNGMTKSVTITFIESEE